MNIKEMNSRRKKIRKIKPDLKIIARISAYSGGDASQLQFLAIDKKYHPKIFKASLSHWADANMVSFSKEKEISEMVDRAVRFQEIDNRIKRSFIFDFPFIA